MRSPDNDQVLDRQKVVEHIFCISLDFWDEEVFLFTLYMVVLISTFLFLILKYFGRCTLRSSLGVRRPDLPLENFEMKFYLIYSDKRAEVTQQDSSSINRSRQADNKKIWFKIPSSRFRMFPRDNSQED